MGITGGNCLVAETGRSIIVTNEGNGDLTQTLARVHIVTSGIERVVPTLDDAVTFLRLLARSATGQETETYTTVSTGPRRADDVDGAQEYPVVLVDVCPVKIPLSGLLREIRRQQFESRLTPTPVRWAPQAWAWLARHAGLRSLPPGRRLDFSGQVTTVDEVRCCGFAGERGFMRPELNEHALRHLKEALPPGCHSGYATSRTCEIGLSEMAEMPCQSILFLLESRSKAGPETTMQIGAANTTPEPR